MALDRLDRLLNVAAPEELRVIDELIGSHDEFTVYTNLSRQFATGQSSLDETPQMPGDDFARRGLAWVMALARVEWSAMLVGFSDEARPLAKVRPSRFEVEAYLELLADAMRCHYWSLVADPVAQAPKKAGLSNPRAVAYTRRVRLARSLLQAFRDSVAAQLAPAQAVELKDWDKRLSKLEFTLLYEVLKLGTVAIGQSSESNTLANYAVGGITVPEEQLADLPACVKGAVQDQQGGTPSAGDSPGESPNR